MDTTRPDRTSWPSWAIHAALGLLPPPVLAVALLTIGPDQITVHRHADWMPIYFAPAALALLGATVTGVRGTRLRVRGGHGYRSLWTIGIVGLLLSVVLLVFALYCLLMAGIGVEDGGWA